jgi:hypothetical protein
MSVSIMSSRNRSRSPATRSITVAALSMKELTNPTSSSRVEGIVVNKKLMVTSADCGTHNKAALACLDLSEGNWYTMRNSLVPLRQQSKERVVFMETVIVAYFGNNNVSGDKDPLTVLEEWVFIEPNNPDARLVYGLLLTATAYKALHDPAGNKHEGERLFEGLISKAQQELQVAVECNPTDPFPYSCLLAASQDTKTAKEIFLKFQTYCKDPHDLRVHEAMLDKLMPKYGGSCDCDEILDFARANSSKAEVGHGLWTLLPLAHVKVWEERKKTDSDADSYWKSMSSSDKKDLVKAFRKYRAKTGTCPENQAGSDMYAFCLYKIRAYKEAYLEFARIGDEPNNEEPWCRESHNYEQAYRKCWGKVQDYCTKKNVDIDTTCQTTSQEDAMANCQAGANERMRGTQRTVSTEAAKMAAQTASDKERQAEVRRTISREAAKAAFERTESRTEVYVNTRNINRTVSHEAAAKARRIMRFGYKK